MESMNINVFNPTKIHFGNGCINDAGKIAIKYSG